MALDLAPGPRIRSPRGALRALAIAALACLSLGPGACERPPPQIESGRYWARLSGYGTTSEDVDFWIEYKPRGVASWSLVPRTAGRTVPAGTDLATVVESLPHLEPGTTYEFRECLRVEGRTLCDPSEPPFSFTTSQRIPGRRSRSIRSLLEPEEPRSAALGPRRPGPPV